MRRLVGGIALLVLVIVLGLAAGLPTWKGHPSVDIGQHSDTTGAIYVSGPQIYTRERLVNDRYREDSWLLDELKASTGKVFGISAQLDMRSSSTREGSMQLGGTAPAAAAGAAGQAASAAVPRVQISPFDEFNALRAYREQIRTQVIENQLDDRHDLRGNSLYRMRFDASVLTGSSTRRSARITVSVLPPEGLLSKKISEVTSNEELRAEELKLAGLSRVEELKNGEEKIVWERLYMRWLDSLQKRFADGRANVHEAYVKEHFTPSDYDLLANEIRADIRVSTLSLQQFRQNDAGLVNLPVKIKDLVGSIDQEDARLVPDAAAQTALDDVRSRYTHLDDGELIGSHRAFRVEIERLLGVLKVRNDLLLQLSLAAPQSPQIAPPSLIDGADSCGGLSAYRSNNIAPLYQARTAEYFLDRAFETKLLKSVVGLDPESIKLVSRDGLVARTKNRIYLNQLASSESRYGDPGVAFRFQRQSAQLVATDLDNCFPPSSEPGSMVLNGTTLRYSKKDVADIAILLSGYDPKTDLESLAVELQANSGNHVAVRQIEVGLMNFIRTVGRQLDAFSYTLAPSESAEITALQAQEQRNRSLGVVASAPISAIPIGVGAKLAEQTASSASTIGRRLPIVGFGEQHNSAVATFGWVIHPQDLVGGEYLQRSSQSSLTALVSLPAWWEEVRVKISTSWTDFSPGGEQQVGGPSEYTIELPVNFETVDASLFETNDRSPIINQWATDRITIRPCENVDIRIPGARLWRSTVVMLGSQRADQIFVLPDMNGIIASFSPVRFPSTWADLGRDFQTPLTVWTSEGSATAPLPVTFKRMEDRLAKPECPLKPRAEYTTGGKIAVAP